MHFVCLRNFLFLNKHSLYNEKHLTYGTKRFEKIQDHPVLQVWEILILV